MLGIYTHAQTMNEKNTYVLIVTNIIIIEVCEYKKYSISSPVNFIVYVQKSRRVREMSCTSLE